jgi:hypothetical protein
MHEVSIAKKQRKGEKTDPFPEPSKKRERKEKKKKKLHR